MSTLLEHFGQLKLDAEVKPTSSKPEIILVNTIPLLKDMVLDLVKATNIAVDLEGINLCRDGKLSLIQLYAQNSSRVYVVHVTVLKEKAFLPHGDSNDSLKSILEDPRIQKIFYDVRNDADALLWLWKVGVANPYDLQLHEACSRNSGRPRLLNGLARTIDTYLSSSNDREASKIKAEGKALFAPEKGGRYSVFEDVPLPSAILKYAAQDVVILFKLKAAIYIASSHTARVLKESNARVRSISSPSYVPNGRHKCLAPTNW